MKYTYTYLPTYLSLSLSLPVFNTYSNDESVRLIDPNHAVVVHWSRQVWSCSEGAVLEDLS